jgi:hypothetical protein
MGIGLIHATEDTEEGDSEERFVFSVCSVLSVASTRFDTKG